MRMELRKLRFTRSSQNDLQYLKRSIEEHGMLRPILVDYDLKVVDGDRRAQACESLGHKDIEIIFVKG